MGFGGGFITFVVCEYVDMSQRLQSLSCCKSMWSCTRLHCVCRRANTWFFACISSAEQRPLMHAIRENITGASFWSEHNSCTHCAHPKLNSLLYFFHSHCVLGYRIAPDLRPFTLCTRLPHRPWLPHQSTITRVCACTTMVVKVEGSLCTTCSVMTMTRLVGTISSFTEGGFNYVMQPPCLA